MRELRWNRSIDRQTSNPAILHPAQQLLHSLDVQGLGKDVFHDLLHQRMVGNLNVAHNIFLAGGNVREDRSKQIVGANALNLRRNLLAALEAQKRQRAVGIPAPASTENGRS